VSDNPVDRRRDFHRLRRRWLPGYALVSRDDLLSARLAELQKTAAEATLLDAWLDLARLNYRATRHAKIDDKSGDPVDTVEWASDARAGWIVPIPVGFASLSSVHPAGTVAGARDPGVPFCFVESVYSIGQWISPHRLDDVKDLLWEPTHNIATGLYRCVNAFRPTVLPLSHID
jgi:CRISPR-associated protein Csy2